MARVNVYLPDDLAEEVKSVGLNVSKLTQEALRSALAASHLGDWRDDIGGRRSAGVDPQAVVAAVSGAKDEIEGLG